MTCPNCVLGVELFLFHQSYWTHSKCFTCTFFDLDTPLSLYIYFKKIILFLKRISLNFLQYLQVFIAVFLWIDYFFIGAALILINANKTVTDIDKMIIVTCWQMDKLILTWESLYLSLSHIIFITTTKSKSRYGHLFGSEGTS